MVRVFEERNQSPCGLSRISFSQHMSEAKLSDSQEETLKEWLWCWLCRLWHRYPFGMSHFPGEGSQPQDIYELGTHESCISRVPVGISERRLLQVLWIEQRLDSISTFLQKENSDNSYHLTSVVYLVIDTSQCRVMCSDTGVKMRGTKMWERYMQKNI